MNEILLVIGMIVIFSSVVIMARYFGEYGLVGFMALAVIMANIAVCKQVEMFSFMLPLGNVLFSSIFLCTDIISEVHGIEHSKRAVKQVFGIAVIFVAVTQLILMFVPSELDMVQDSMVNLFTMSLRTTTASIACFFIANMADVYIFDSIKKKLPKQLWLRNNVGTILCNCLENFLFVFAAFGGILPMPAMIEAAVTGCFIETLVGICDTPFVYLGRRAAKKWQSEEESASRLTKSNLKSCADSNAL